MNRKQTRIGSFAPQDASLTELQRPRQECIDTKPNGNGLPQTFCGEDTDTDKVHNTEVRSCACSTPPTISEMTKNQVVRKSRIMDAVKMQNHTSCDIFDFLTD